MRLRRGFALLWAILACSPAAISQTPRIPSVWHKRLQLGPAVIVENRQ